MCDICHSSYHPLHVWVWYDCVQCNYWICISYANIASIIFDECEAAAQKVFTSQKLKKKEAVSAYGLFEFIGKKSEKIKAEIDAVSV